MGIYLPKGVNLGSQSGIRLGIKPSSGGGGDPLAGIPFALRLQTHAGFGATPNAPIGLYQNYKAGVRFVMPTLVPADVSQFVVSVDGAGGTGYSFAPTDPMDGTIYLGEATGDAPTDGAVLVAAITSNQPCTGSMNGSQVTLTSNTLGGSTNLTVFGPSVNVASNWPSVSGATPATADGDPIGAYADVLGTSGFVAVQSNTMLQPVLRIVNGVPVVRGDGVGTLLSISNWSYNSANTAYIEFCASGLINAYTSLLNTYQDFAGSDAGAGLLVKSSGKTAVYVVGNSAQHNYDGTGAATIAADSAFHCFTAEWQTDAINSWMDGSVDGEVAFSDTIKTSVGSQLAEIGGSALFAGRSLAGDMVAVLFAASAHDPTTRSDVETFVASLSPP